MRQAVSLLLAFLLVAPMNLVSAAKLTQGASEGTSQGQASTPLTNRDVSDMLKSGLTPEIVVAKIKGSTCNFDTSPAALQELKVAGVPDSVILVMVQNATLASTYKTLTTPASPTTMTAPKRSETVDLKVPDGTSVEIELKSTVSSEDLQVGSIVDFAVIQPVKINGVTVIERRAPAKARIVEVKKARHWGRAGKIAWAMQDTVGVDGNRIPLRFTKEAEGGGSSGKVAGATIATAVVFWPAAPFWGLKKGKPAVLPAGTRFDVSVHGDSTIKESPSKANCF